MNKRMLIATILVTSFASSVIRAAPGTSSSPSLDRCVELVGVELEAGIVESAEKLSAGATVVGGGTAGAKVATDLCRVRAQLNPVPGSDIKVEVWLPDNWNNKLFAIGGGGFDGGLNPGGAAVLNNATSQGYAAVATDVGHTPASTPEAWAYNQPEKIIDFGHRGNHLTAVTAKQVIAAYYGDPAEHSYFFGCSNGGRDALMEVSRYPEDYDGVVAGAPALNYIEIVTQILWNSQAVHGPGGAPNLDSKRDLVHAAVMKKCDELDGLKDGILENPHACRFDPAELRCTDHNEQYCLTDAEVAGFSKIYGGLRLNNGQQIYHGPALGSEGLADNWSAWVTSPEGSFIGQEFYRWLVYHDPDWNVETFNPDRDYVEAHSRLASVINVEDPDISAFTERGGKLIIYQGWDDPAITPASTIQYYEDVQRTLGPAATDSVRLFMVPGMMHCAGGPGAHVFDMQPELEKWVEQGEAPKRVIATHPGDEGESFTRPLCPWPKTAHYKGSGSTKDAASFTCEASVKTE